MNNYELIEEFNEKLSEIHEAIKALQDAQPKTPSDITNELIRQLGQPKEESVNPFEGVNTDELLVVGVDNDHAASDWKTFSRNIELRAKNERKEMQEEIDRLTVTLDAHVKANNKSLSDYLGHIKELKDENDKLKARLKESYSHLEELHKAYIRTAKDFQVSKFSLLIGEAEDNGII